jgi:hypothetical protein
VVRGIASHQFISCCRIKPYKIEFSLIKPRREIICQAVLQKYFFKGRMVKLKHGFQLERRMNFPCFLRRIIKSEIRKFDFYWFIFFDIYKPAEQGRILTNPW